MPETPDPPSVHPARVEVVLLAAGRSARMGGADKLLLAVPDAGGGTSGASQPMLRAAARLYLSLGLPVTVVVQDPHGAAARALAGLDIGLAINAHPARADPLPRHASNSRGDDGQQASVLAGLRATRLAADGVLIALADQPLLTPHDIAALIACFDSHGATRICIPRRAGQRGNPVIMPVALARALRDDPAAPSPRRYIDQHPEDVVWFEAANDHFTRDIDTPEDALALDIAVSSGHNIADQGLTTHSTQDR